MPGADRELQRAHLVGRNPVHGNPVGRGEDLPDHPPGHAPGRHVVGNQRRIDPHLADRPGGEPRPLQVGPGLRAEDFDVLAVLPGKPEHVKQAGAGKTVRQNRVAVLQERLPMPTRLPGYLLLPVKRPREVFPYHLRRGSVRARRIDSLHQLFEERGQMKARRSRGFEQRCRLLQTEAVPHPSLALQSACRQIKSVSGRDGNVTGALDHHLPNGPGDLLGLRAIDRVDRAGQLAAVDDNQRLVFQIDVIFQIHEERFRRHGLASVLRPCRGRIAHAKHRSGRVCCDVLP